MRIFFNEIVQLAADFLYRCIQRHIDSFKRIGVQQRICGIGNRACGRVPVTQYDTHGILRADVTIVEVDIQHQKDTVHFRQAHVDIGMQLSGNGFRQNIFIAHILCHFL